MKYNAAYWGEESLSQYAASCCWIKTFDLTDIMKHPANERIKVMLIVNSAHYQALPFDVHHSVCLQQHRRELPAQSESGHQLLAQH